MPPIPSPEDASPVIADCKQGLTVGFEQYRHYQYRQGAKEIVPSPTPLPRLERDEILITHITSSASRR
jgi:hypothetical protein